MSNRKLKNNDNGKADLNPGESRRSFLKKAGAAAVSIAGTDLITLSANKLSIQI